MTKELFQSLQAFQKDFTLFIPLGVAVLCIPSLIFNFKRLNQGEEKSKLSGDLLDLDPVDQEDFQKGSTFLWLANLFFGIYTSILGVLVALLLTKVPKESFFLALFSGLVMVTLFFTGISVIVLGRKR